MHLKISSAKRRPFSQGERSWLEATPMERAVAMIATLRAGLCYEAQHSVGQNIQWRGRYTLYTKTEQYVKRFVTSANGEDYMIITILEKNVRIEIAIRNSIKQ